MYEVRTIHETVSSHDNPKSATAAAKAHFAMHKQYVEIRNPKGERIYHYGEFPLLIHRGN